MNIGHISIRQYSLKNKNILFSLPMFYSGILIIFLLSLELIQKIPWVLGIKKQNQGCLGDSVKRLTFAQVMISQFMCSSPTLGSVLTVHSLLGILSLFLSLSLCPSPIVSLSLKKRKK